MSPTSLRERGAVWDTARSWSQGSHRGKLGPGGARDSRRRLLALALLTATGCSFDAHVPAGVSVPCSVAAPECPDALVCDTGLGLCVSKDKIDLTPPRLVNAVVPTAALKRGDTLVVSFDTSEAVRSPPAVKLLERGLPVGLTVTSSSDTHFVAQRHPSFAA